LELYTQLNDIAASAVFSDFAATLQDLSCGSAAWPIILAEGHRSDF